MKYIGIDPGKSKGAIAAIENNNLSLYSIPKIGGKEIDLDQLDKILFDLKYSPNGDKVEEIDCMCVLEKVHAIPKSSAAGTFQFGRGFGIIEGMLTSNRISFVEIPPKDWQKEAWKGVEVVKINTGKKTKAGNIKYKTDTKATSLMAAKRLFPNETFLATERSSVPHDGLVDAALIAWYCKLKY